MNTEIVYDCWARTGGRFVYTPVRMDGVWDNGPRHSPRERDVSFTAEGDQYFTPLGFNGDRKNHLVSPGIHVLYADLDPVNPERLEIAPSVAWETSPGSYQALWWLSAGIRPDKFADLNQRMTYFTGADRGGWHASKVLRVPGSVNHKRGGIEGRVLWHTGRRFSTQWLDKKLPPVEGEGTLPNPTISMPPIPDFDRAGEVRAGYKLGLRTQSLLNRTWTDDRSMTIWKAINCLLDDGVTPEDAFQILWWLPVNKWRKERRPQRLWQDIMRASAR